MPSSAVYPGSRVVSRAMCYGVYISEIHYARIYAAIYRYTDACIPDKRYADGSLERVEIDLCRKNIYLVNATSYIICVHSFRLREDVCSE